MLKTITENLLKRFRTKPTARRAFVERNVQASFAAHLEQEESGKSGDYLADAVLGGIDGIITTFAVVAGVVGAELSPETILILGTANLLADGLSMGVGNYLGAKSQQDYYKSEREREEWEVEHLPEFERKEVEEIYKAKGFSGELLKKIVDHITSDKELWIDTMMREELNISMDKTSPIVSGLVTFLAFVVFGSVPLIVYALSAFLNINLSQEEQFVICSVSSLLSLFLVGAFRVKFTLRPWFTAGLEIALLGGIAGGVSFYIGHVLASTLL